MIFTEEEFKDMGFELEADADISGEEVTDLSEWVGENDYCKLHIPVNSGNWLIRWKSGGEETWFIDHKVDALNMLEMLSFDVQSPYKVLKQIGEALTDKNDLSIIEESWLLAIEKLGI